MKEFFRFFAGFFEEEPGVSSSHRLIFIAGSFFNMFLTYRLAMHSTTVDPVAIGILFVTIEAVLAGQKLWSKGMEEESTQNKALSILKDMAIDKPEVKDVQKT